MVCFQTKIPNLCKFWRVLLWKILLYFMAIWPILRPLEIFHCHLIYFVAIWCIFPRFGILDLEKSGNPELQSLDVLQIKIPCHGLCIVQVPNVRRQNVELRNYSRHF
jgi:hypothetical protein